MGRAMHTIFKDFSFSSAHAIRGHTRGCQNLHGHNYRVRVHLQASQLDALGMVMDFGRLKQDVGGWIDATLDHKMLLHRDDPVLSFLRQQGEPVFVMDGNPTAENIARLIFEQTARQGFPVVEVRLWETETCFASYTASRGADDVRPKP